MLHTVKDMTEVNVDGRRILIGNDAYTFALLATNDLSSFFQASTRYFAMLALLLIYPVGRVAAFHSFKA